MSPEKTDLPDDLLRLSQQFKEWRSAHPPRTRLPEAMWAAAAEMAQRYGLHDTAKVLRLEAMRLKQRLPEGTSAQPAATRFLELLTPATAGPAECVVEVESSRGRMRVAMKGVAPDWGGLLRAWRETAG